MDYLLQKRIIITFSVGKKLTNQMLIWNLKSQVFPEPLYFFQVNH